MAELILHHYELSTFSEKIRSAFGLKKLPWRSVDTPPAPPRPLLMPLTGGYRRIPVLQVGADIYCDTNIILPALERLHPEPTFYPSGSEGLARGLSFAWERAMWIPTIGVISHFIGDMFPAEFIRDRKEGYLGIDISKTAMAPSLPLHLQHLHAQYAWLKSALADGRPFIFGDRPSALDLTCYQTTFLMRKNCPGEVDKLAGLTPLIGWYDRIAALGHGAPLAMSADEAFSIAKAAHPTTPSHLPPNGDPSGLYAGQKVTVTPDDNARVPVTGTLVAADASEIVIHRRDHDAGDLHIHFPRLGFDVVAA
ncbi:putative glutathione S-transferase [Bradyrhizobium sp. ORS 278]|uniref:glutathione S-transferase family protein n=1 Tax=Bradyrhizobium sp. (strain ORS 278) TaxID=114615 RepID=UPI00015086B5|nr:glutathione S-transferase family protein [Bradyrhizobium sp. ORS 278]CAL78532.1 putative glutathione S-transferase [Bradyrhizobium sp. ORS 278]